jgi:coiled-coil domain-containing protein 55
MKLSFSLAKPAKPVGAAPPLKPAPAFSTLDDDEGNEDSRTIESHSKKKNNNSKLVSQHAITSKAIRKRMEAEKKVDDTVYEYDEVWDKMQEAKQRAKEAKEVDSAQRKVCELRFSPLFNPCIDHILCSLAEIHQGLTRNRGNSSVRSSTC